MQRFSLFYIVLALFVIICCSKVQAHNVWGVGNPKMPAEAQINEADLAKAYDNVVDPDLRYVYERALTWTPGTTLKGCFFGGSEAQRSRVIQAASELLRNTGVNIVIDFGDTENVNQCMADGSGYYPEDIRVSLQDGCCSAYIGTSAHSKRQWSDGSSIAKGPSVFLQNSNNSPTIKHELIHALGFHHEHQKPTSPCKFDYDAIAKAYGWSKSDVQTNFDKLEDKSRKYVYSKAFDPDSIMKYHFESDLLIGGTNSPVLLSAGSGSF